MDTGLSIENMVAIPLKEVGVGSALPVNIYIRLSSGKFIRVAKAQEHTNVDSMSLFAEQRIEVVYVKKNEYHRLVSRKLAEVDVVMNHSQIPVVKKTAFLRSAFSTVISEISEMGVSAESMMHAKNLAAHAVGMAQARPPLADLLLALQDSSEWILNHSLGTSLFAVMIAKEMDWQNTQTLEKLALGGLLQDVGLKELPKHIQDTSRANLSYEDRQLYETHPYRSLKLLQSVGEVPDDVVSIAYEHHENAQGMGFPRHLRDLKMNPLARVVCLANTLCEVTLLGPENGSLRTLPEAISYIETVMGQPFNKEAYRALRQLVHNGRPRLNSIKVA